MPKEKTYCFKCGKPLEGVLLCVNDVQESLNSKRQKNMGINIDENHKTATGAG